MKVNISVECTPEEARSFFGLPDVSRAQQVYVDKVSRMMGDSVGSAAVGDLVKSWSTLGGVGLNLAQQILGPLAAAGEGGRGRDRDPRDHDRRSPSED